MTDELLMTIEEARRLLRIGRNKAYELAHEGTIPTVRLGKRLLVPRARLMEYLEKGFESTERQVG